MQSVFNVLFIWLFIYLIFLDNDNFKINCATLWPGLFAQTLRTPPLFWGSPTSFYSNHPNTASANDDLTNLQQSESNGHLFASAEQHMISSDEPIPSGLFIPIDQLHRELYNAPHLLRKHSSNHYPSYHQFNLNHFHHHPNKKLISSSKHHHFKTYPSKFKQFNKNFYNGGNNKKNNKPKDDFNEKFNYLDDDFYSKQNLFNLNKLNSHLIEFPDYNQELEFATNSNTATGNNKNWHPRLNKQQNDQDHTNSLVNISEEQQDEQDDLFTIHTKNQSNELPILMKNGRIDLRKSNKRKNNLKDHHHSMKDNSKELKIIKELRDLRNLKETLKDLKELKDNKDQLKPSSINENRYLDNYDSHNNQDNEKLNENRNIEKYNLERFLNQDKLNQKENRNDGRILINQSNQQRKEKSNQQHHQHENLNNGDLSVISETIYQNHQNLLKNDNRRSPSRLILMQNYDRHFDVDSDKKQNNNESITILTNDNFIPNKTDEQIDTQNNQLNLSKTELPKLINNNKIDLLNNEEQMNQQQLYGTTLWNAQRIIPTPQISYMQSMFTESNTLTPSTEQITKSTYLSERSQLKNNNNNNNHFSTLAISCIIVASLIAAVLFTGFSSSLFLMYKVSQIKKRRLMRFQETASRNQFESSFPVQTNCKSSHTSKNSSLNSGTSSNLLNNNIISNNNFIRQQKSLFSNLNTRCNTNKAILSINDQIDTSNFTIKNKNQSNKTATINKKVGKNLNLNHLNLASGSNGECYVTQIKQINTSSNEKNSALNRLISKMSNQINEANEQPINKTNSSDLDQQQNNQQQNLPPLPPAQQRVSFF